MKRWVVMAWLVASSASAQPRGPADIMNGANEDRRQQELQRAVRAGDGVAKVALPDAGTAPIDEAANDVSKTPPAEDPHDHKPNVHAALNEPALPVAEPLRSLPVGSIQVVVAAPNGERIPNAEIVLGVMQSLGGRTEQRAKTDEHGEYLFQHLPVGTQQAYRVNVLREGAKFSTTPFRLPDDMGYVARVPLLPATTDTRMLFQMIGQTVVELRDDRLHVSQQARLANAGQDVIVLPKDGLEIPLPEGFTAFTWQDQMTDQKGEELAGKGFRIRGSLPPGTVTLTWTFDLKRSGDSVKIPISQPWRTYQYRVISEAPAGLKLRVTDFPEPEAVRDKDRDLLFTQKQNSPQDVSTASFTIKIDGIPTPGPGRWIALVLAVFAMGVGLVVARNPADDAPDRKLAIAARKQELLALAKQTESELERGDIGPQYRAEKLDEILTELALVLRDEEALAKG
ncbi:MAG TPA: carboxypeptidase-like regulatory domain-containing protein [Polyangiales bacterium]|nr:carboxypeptidase-like regulatory domain-containing protein [Polyangiales bacterium]